VLSRIIYGARASLLVGFMSVAGALVLGTALGLCRRLFRRRWSTPIVMRAMDVLFAFPGILLALAITAALGPSLDQRDPRHRGRQPADLRAARAQRRRW
jgi:peptide/nickel transport system permease protein